MQHLQKMVSLPSIPSARGHSLGQITKLVKEYQKNRKTDRPSNKPYTSFANNDNDEATNGEIKGPQYLIRKPLKNVRSSMNLRAPVNKLAVPLNQ